MEFHKSVLLNQVLQYLDAKPGEIVVDATLGGAGHSLELAKKIEPNGTLVGIDLDPAALAQAGKLLEAGRLSSKIILVRENYKNMDMVLSQQGISQADKILADVGISSYDLESSHRGFSFQKDEPLDMRFDPESKPTSRHKQPFTAAYILSSYSEKELEKIFFAYGEEKFSKKIARGIVAARQEHDITTTIDLFNLIKKSLPANVRYKAADSARRVFQSLRIEVNAELENLKVFLPKAFKILKPGGRLAIISFHSLEDRIVKQYFLDKAKGCVCPPEFPVCKCGRNPEGKILTRKPITAGEDEQKENPRSKPAKLRVIQKI